MEPDYDDPATEEQWCHERRREVVDYLEKEGVPHGRVGEWPAWHLAPYAAVWAIESAESPNWVGWWVISGDMPCDYVSAEKIKHPRDALREISRRWMEVSEDMARGRQHPGISIGPKGEQRDLAPELRSRAEILKEWVGADELWEDDAS